MLQIIACHGKRQCEVLSDYFLNKTSDWEELYGDDILQELTHPSRPEQCFLISEILPEKLEKIPNIYAKLKQFNLLLFIQLDLVNNESYSSIHCDEEYWNSWVDFYERSLGFEQESVYLSDALDPHLSYFYDSVGYASPNSLPVFLNEKELLLLTLLCQKKNFKISELNQVFGLEIEVTDSPLKAICKFYKSNSANKYFVKLLIALKRFYQDGLMSRFENENSRYSAVTVYLKAYQYELPDLHIWAYIQQLHLHNANLCPKPLPSLCEHSPSILAKLGLRSYPLRDFSAVFLSEAFHFTDQRTVISYLQSMMELEQQAKLAYPAYQFFETMPKYLEQQIRKYFMKTFRSQRQFPITKILFYNANKQQLCTYRELPSYTHTTLFMKLDILFIQLLLPQVRALQNIQVGCIQKIQDSCYFLQPSQVIKDHLRGQSRGEMIAQSNPKGYEITPVKVEHLSSKFWEQDQVYSKKVVSENF